MKNLIILTFLLLLGTCAFAQDPNLTTVRIPLGSYQESWTTSPTYSHPHDTFPCGVYFPADFNTKKCALMLFFPGNPANNIGDAEDIGVGYWQFNNMKLDDITIPGTANNMSIMIVYLWDSARKAGPEVGAVPSVLRSILSLWSAHIDTTRIYASGISSGAGTALACASTADSIARYFKAIVSMNGANVWHVPGPGVFDASVIYEGTAILLNRYMPHIWQMHTTSDGNVPYSSNAIPWRDSCNKYAPGLNHLTSASGGHNTMWVPWSRDTAGPEPAFFHAVATTIGLGGKPFMDSYYQWLLLFPLVNQKYFPILTGSVQLKGGDLTTITPDTEEPVIFHDYYADCVLCSTERSNGKKRNYATGTALH